jgi:hypothetical protein
VEHGFELTGPRRCISTDQRINMSFSPEDQRVLDELEASLTDAWSLPRRPRRRPGVLRLAMALSKTLMTPAGLMLAVLGVAIAGATGTILGIAGFLVVWIGLHQMARAVGRRLRSSTRRFRRPRYGP